MSYCPKVCGGADIQKYLSIMNRSVENPEALHEELSAHANLLNHKPVNVNKVFINFDTSEDSFSHEFCTPFETLPHDLCDMYGPDKAIDIYSSSHDYRIAPSHVHVFYSTVEVKDVPFILELVKQHKRLITVSTDSRAVVETIPDDMKVVVYFRADDDIDKELNTLANLPAEDFLPMLADYLLSENHI